MAIKVWNGSSWDDVSIPRAWNGSSWTDVDAGYVWNGSSWVQFFPNGMVGISNQYVLTSLFGGGTGSATYRLYSDGQAYYSGLDGTTFFPLIGEWLLSGSVSDYEVYASWSGGGGTVFGPTGSWISLGTDREWALSATNSDETRDLSLQIRLAANSVVLVSATITMQVDAAP